MTPKIRKTARAALYAFRWTFLPPLVLVADFVAVVTVSILVLWLVVVMPVRALAQEQPQTSPAATMSDVPQVIHASTVDIDRDGTLDRTVLVRNPKTRDADLYIYLKAGGLTPIPARDFARAASASEDAAERKATQAIKSNTATDPTPVRPDLVFPGIAEDRVFDFEKHGTSLAIMTGCGGCQEGTDTKVTIVHRNGQYLVGAYALIWTKAGSRGRCDIDFLAGRGKLTTDFKTKKLDGKFKPVRLAEWQKDNPPRACAI